MGKVNPLVRNIADAVYTSQANQVQAQYLTAVNGTPGVGQFRSSITGRARCIDPSKDMGVRMGVDRIPFQQQLIPAPGEYGPNNEPVWKLANDKYDWVRFVGQWKTNVSTHGVFALPAANSTDYVEAVIYGTGLNVFSLIDGAYDWRATVDGGAEGANFFPATGSSVLNARLYSPNSTANASNGLTFGLHTIKIRQQTSGTWLYGLEVLNESSTIKVSGGSAIISGKLVDFSATDLTYNSGFESGTLSTKGGRVLVYGKADGTIKHAVTPVDTTAFTVSGVTHANEEPIRTYFWREFGVGRADDFSLLGTSTGSRAYVLDDGITELECTTDLANFTGTAGSDTLQSGNTTRPVVINFTGCGLDVYMDTAGGSNVTNVSVDGAANVATVSTTGRRLQVVASGLAYGTHVISFDYASGGGNSCWEKFVVYGPKKPTLPSNAIELGEYRICANAVANTTVGRNTISQGVIRRSPTRELTLAGTVTINSSNNQTGQWQISIDSVNGTATLYFLGVGFDLRWRSSASATSSATLTLDGVTNFTVTNGAHWTGALTTNAYGTGISFTAATGILDQKDAATQAGVGVSVLGLNYGYHVLQFKNTTGAADSAILEAIDIYPLIHCHRSAGPQVMQNALAIYASVGDLRNFGTQLKVDDPVCSVQGITDNSTSLTSTAFLPLGDMCSSFYAPEDGFYEFSSMVSARDTSATAAQDISWTFYIDGFDYWNVQRQWNESNEVATANLNRLLHVNTGPVAVAKGWHTVVLMYKVSAGTWETFKERKQFSIKKVS